QSTISNLFAGLSLQVDRTINVGDWVQIGSRTGKILEFKWRSTLLVTRDGDAVILPNSSLLGNEVLNFCKPTKEHRATVKVGIAYRHPPNEVKKILLGAVDGVPGVLKTPAPTCAPAEFGDSAIIYALRYWIDDMQREIAIEGEVRTRLWYSIQRAALEVPYPTRTLITHQASDVAVAEKQEQSERQAALAGTDLFGGLD